MTTSNIIKKQRDRFLAFSFASADLFIETNAKGKILFTLGAAKGLTGIEDDDLIGRNWLELFDLKDHSKLIRMQDEAEPAMRRGPLLVNLEGTLINRKGIVTAIKMPGSNNFYVTMSLGSVLMEKLATMMDEENPEPIITGFKATDETIKTVTTGFKATDEAEESLTTGFDAGALGDDAATVTTGFKATDEAEESLTTGFDSAPQEDDATAVTTGFKATDEDTDIGALTTGFTAGDDAFEGPLYNTEDFVSESEQAFEAARAQNIKAALTIFDFGNTETIPEENWAEMIDEIAIFLRDQSIDGKAAAELADGKYSLIHDESIDTAIMEEKINAISKERDPEGNGIDVSSKTVNADLDTLTSAEAARALFYTLNEFEKSGEEFTMESLGSGLKTFVSANTQRLQEFKNIIERVDFDIHFQPIVNLATKEAKHYEALSRFHTGDTQEWIMFGEDVGLSASFDLAVVERVMNFIHYKAGTTRTKFSINISGKSIENATFFEELQEQLARRDYANRIIFEITESSRIHDLKKAGKFIGKLQDAGYEVALDDFGAGSASFEYLQKLNVNFVKIDGKYVRRLLESKRNEVMIRNLVKMCKDLGTKTVAEYVEQQEQADLLIEMGIDYGQGHLFGEARPRPDYTPPVT